VVGADDDDAAWNMVQDRLQHRQVRRR
jgi:hypothetical protein